MLAFCQIMCTLSLKSEQRIVERIVATLRRNFSNAGGILHRTFCPAHAVAGCACVAPGDLPHEVKFSADVARGHQHAQHPVGEVFNLANEDCAIARVSKSEGSYIGLMIWSSQYVDLVRRVLGGSAYVRFRE